MHQFYTSGDCAAAIGAESPENRRHRLTPPGRATTEAPHPGAGQPRFRDEDLQRIARKAAQINLEMPCQLNWTERI
jgi:hypothetical protein